MLFAVLTAILFALSAVTSTRLTRIMASISANFWRLLFAAFALGLLTLAFSRDSFHPHSFGWLFFSGVIGFGIGDIALFLAYPRIGSRLTVLINFCFATVCGAVADQIWLGDSIAPAEWASIAVILGGLAMALLATRVRGSRHGSFVAGVIAALVAGFGQGFGATISRHAETVSLSVGVEVGGLSQAFQRVVAGLCCVTLVYVWMRVRGSIPKPAASPAKIAPWLLGAALFGPVIGVSCFQQSLLLVGNSGVVMAVVATSPLIMIPLAYLFEGDHPTRLSVLGAIIGVAGVISIALLRA